MERPHNGLVETSSVLPLLPGATDKMKGKNAHSGVGAEEPGARQALPGDSDACDSSEPGSGAIAVGPGTPMSGQYSGLPSGAPVESSQVRVLGLAHCAQPPPRLACGPQALSTAVHLPWMQMDTAWLQTDVGTPYLPKERFALPHCQPPSWPCATSRPAGLPGEVPLGAWCPGPSVLSSPRDCWLGQP